jgi:uncharacterized protein
MITSDDILNIEKIAQRYFHQASGCHDWSHIERVRALALRIGKREKANLKIIELAILLHDIGRKFEMKNKGKKNGIKICHAQKSRRESQKILKDFKNITPEEKESILHCVEAHRNRNELTPNTSEAMVVFDADKLDSIGAVGIARDFLFAGGAGSNCLYTGNEKILAKTGQDYSYTKEDSAILEYEIKLKYIKNKMMTMTGRRIAKKRDEFMQEFFKIFWMEVEGER